MHHRYSFHADDPAAGRATTTRVPRPAAPLVRAVGDHEPSDVRTPFVDRRGRVVRVVRVGACGGVLLVLACARTRLVATCPPVTPLPAIDVRVTSGDSGAVTGQITGHVLRRVVEYARVTLEPGLRVTMADGVGRFRFDAVPAGAYVLDVRRVGYRARVDSLAVPARGVTLGVSLEEIVFHFPCVNPEMHRVRRRWWWW